MRAISAGKKLVKCLFLLLLPGLLSACFNMAVTGAQAVYNRHNLEKNFNDQTITMQAFKKINVQDARFKDTNIAIATFNAEVLLAGQTPSAWQREQAEKLVRAIPNVKRVYNLVSIQPPSSTIKRMSDSWLTAKVKAKLIASNDLDATKIKVVTENGTVYLMGIVPPSEASAAVDIARTTDGVERVVKIFSYVHITKT